MQYKSREYLVYSKHIILTHQKVHSIEKKIILARRNKDCKKKAFASILGYIDWETWECSIYRLPDSAMQSKHILKLNTLRVLTLCCYIPAPKVGTDRAEITHINNYTQHNQLKIIGV